MHGAYGGATVSFGAQLSFNEQQQDSCSLQARYCNPCLPGLVAKDTLPGPAPKSGNVKKNKILDLVGYSELGPFSLDTCQLGIPS